MNALALDLRPGFSILWYQIESVLGRGGFGITYLARDTNLDQLVAIKEYLPHDFATRSGDSTVQPVSKDQEDMYSWGLERFMSEAQTLAKFRHPNIVRVQSVFKQNNTGYMVMEYEHGRPLYDIYKEKKQLSQKSLEAIYYPIVDGLSAVHQQGFIHRDIKPGNIYIRKDGSPVLLDFGAARQAVGTHSRTLTSMLTVGYAPFEQYHEGSGKQGPWTDVYALCACLYEGIMGHKPKESAQRGMALLHNESDPYNPLSAQKIPGYDYAFLRGIDQGLMIQINDRPQTLESLMGMLKGEIQLPKIAPRSEPEQPAHIDKTVIRPLNRPLTGQPVNRADGKGENSVQARQVLDSDSIAPTRENSIRPVTGHRDTVNPESSRGIRKKWVLVSLQVLIILALVVALIVLLTRSDKQNPVVKDTAHNQSSIDIEKNSKQQKISQLLKQAEDFYQANIYINSGSDHALSRYLQVLSLDEQNKTAMTRLNSIAKILLGEADQLIELNRVSDATDRLDAVSLINPELPELKRLQKKLTETVQQVKTSNQLEMLLDQARQAVDKSHLYKPMKESALEIYQAVLSIDPENSIARSSLIKISDQIISDAHSAMSKQQYDQVKALVSLAEQITPESTAVTEIKNKLAQRVKLNRLIESADAAYNEQRYTSPSNGSAVNLYREILLSYPNNEHAKNRLTDIASRYAKTIRQAINAGNLKTAEYNLDILGKHFPQFKDIQSLQKELEKLKSSSSIVHLIPVGVNQSQDDGVVVEDIVGLFVRNFNNRNIQQLKQVAQLSKEQEGLYADLFNLYQHLDLKLVPQSFTINRAAGVATASFQISDLVDKKGRTVTTTANWTRLALNIQKKNGSWLKAEISNY